MNCPSDGYRYLRVDSAVLRQEIYLTGIGGLSSAAGSPYPPPGHPAQYDFDWSRGRILGDFAAVLLSRGAGVFETRSGSSSCKAGDVLLIPPGTWHRYRPLPETGWREHWLCANGEFLHRLRSKRCFLGKAEVCRGGLNSAMLAAHRRLWNEITGTDTPNDLALGAQALLLFGMAMRAVPGPQRSRPTTSPRDGNPVADAANEFIWYNSTRALTVGLIAQHVGVSRRTLERRYLQANGTTVIHELMARRVQHARQLLTETSMSAKEISYAVGFGAARRLFRNFSRATGTTPELFRRHARRD